MKKKLCVPVYHQWYTMFKTLMVKKYITQIIYWYRFRAFSTTKLNYIHITLQFLSQLAKIYKIIERYGKKTLCVWWYTTSITQMVQKYMLCTTGGHVQNSTFSVLLRLQTRAKIARAMLVIHNIL